MPEKEKGGLLEKIIPVLLILTVALAFMVGVLWQKVSTLEGGRLKNALTNQDSSKDDSEVPVDGKLSEEESTKVKGLTEADWLRGERDADAILIEYSDLECPWCQRFHPVVKEALGEYQGKLSWVYRHWPGDLIHPKADKEAEAAECAGEQGGQEGFWKFVDKIYEVTPGNNGLDLDKLPEYAGEVGLDMEEFKTCLDSGKFADKVESQYQEGISAGVGGTPGVFIMNKKGEVWVVGGYVPLESLKVYIDQALKS